MNLLKKRNKKNIVFVFLLIALAAFLFFINKKSRIEKKHEILSDSISSLNGEFFNKSGSPIRPLGSTNGYKLICQIFIDEVELVNKNIGNFTIHAISPCWYSLENNQKKSITIPILIEDKNSETFISPKSTSPGKIDFKIEGAIKKSMSQYAFRFGDRQEPSVLVGLYFANRHLVERSLNPIEIFLKPLCTQYNTLQELDEFAQSGIWQKNFNEYLVYDRPQVLTK